MRELDKGNMEARLQHDAHVSNAFCETPPLNFPPAGCKRLESHQAAWDFAILQPRNKKASRKLQ